MHDLSIKPKSNVKSMSSYKWPRSPISWIEGDTTCYSVPFTWKLPEIKKITIINKNKKFLIGGPAIQLMPNYFDSCENVVVGGERPGTLQIMNPYATRTSLGCPRKCKFCAIGNKLMEPKFIELDDWPILPVICDNNLIASSDKHFHSVIDKLMTLEWVDFNSGLDARLMKDHHAKRFAELKNPMIRIAFDSDDIKEHWLKAIDILRANGIPLNSIRSYCLIGFSDSIEADYKRLLFIESMNIKPTPSWYHPLNALEHNAITEDQINAGWNKEERNKIMQYAYMHSNKAEIRKKYGYKSPRSSFYSKYNIIDNNNINTLENFNINSNKKMNVAFLQFNSTVRSRGNQNNDKIPAGLAAILSDVDNYKYNLYPVTIDDKNILENSDRLLISLTSPMDVFNLYHYLTKAIKNDTKMPYTIVGGPGMINPAPFSHLVDAAFFGRADNCINKLIDKDFEGLENYTWRKNHDPDFNNNYILRPIEKLYSFEKASGCKYKCKFCQYSWTHKLLSNENHKSDKYVSGLTNVENFFNNINWTQNRGQHITAIDGLTQDSRDKVNKPISNQNIIDKLLQLTNDKPKFNYKMKLYNIVGFPWESELNLSELKYIFKQIPKSFNHKLTIDIFHNHFSPMLFTPLALNNFNFLNFRKLLCTKNNYIIFKLNNFICKSSMFSQSPIPAIEATFVQRANKDDHELFNIFLSKDYSKLKVDDKIDMLLSILPNKFYDNIKQNELQCKTSYSSM